MDASDEEGTLVVAFHAAQSLVDDVSVGNQLAVARWVVDLGEVAQRHGDRRQPVTVIGIAHGQVREQALCDRGVGDVASRLFEGCGRWSCSAEVARGLVGHDRVGRLGDCFGKLRVLLRSDRSIRCPHGPIIVAVASPPLVRSGDVPALLALSVVRLLGVPLAREAVAPVLLALGVGGGAYRLVGFQAGAEAAADGCG